LLAAGSRSGLPHRAPQRCRFLPTLARWLATTSCSSRSYLPQVVAVDAGCQSGVALLTGGRLVAWVDHRPSQARVGAALRIDWDTPAEVVAASGRGEVLAASAGQFYYMAVLAPATTNPTPGEARPYSGQTAVCTIRAETGAYPSRVLMEMPLFLLSCHKSTLGLPC
jgi:hypothetical protein